MNALKAVVIAALATFTAASFAAHCPADMKKIDAALSAGTQLSEAELNEVKKLRIEGEELHNAGKHKESVEALGKAMKMLGIN